MLIINVAASALMAVNLQSLLVVLLLALEQSHTVFSEGVLQIRIAVARFLAPVLIPAALHDKGGGISRRWLTQYGG